MKIENADSESSDHESADQKSTDALADVLNAIRLSATTYYCVDYEPPWSLSFDASSDAAMFHVIVRGSCWLKVEHAMDPTFDISAAIKLEEGDIVAFPTGGAHYISDDQSSCQKQATSQTTLQGTAALEALRNKEKVFRSEAGADSVMPGAHTILCGSFEYDSSLDHPFLKELPCFIHIKAKERSAPDLLAPLIFLLVNESQNPKPGSTVMLDRLAEVLFIQLIRAYMQNQAHTLAYMAALGDFQIGRALNLIHAESKARWTVERLRERLGMSRTAFTEKFSRMVGMPPKTYLLKWRMQKAKARLEAGKDTMISIAEASGYASEAAFSKAFKQYFDISPGKLRPTRGQKTNDKTKLQD